MRLTPTRAIGLLAVLVGLAAGPGSAGAQAPIGVITGRVTDAHGAPLVGITVAAAPVSRPDAVTLASTDTTGAYVLTLAPGDYYVAFNTLEPIDDRYGPVTFGGPGPGPGAVCTVCGGRPVSVTAGGTTTGIGAALASPPFPQTGFVRPLSGKAIRVVGGRVSFRMGCHVEPTGCTGTARLRLGTRVSATPIASVRVAASPGQTAELVFRLPSSVIARLRRAARHVLAASVEISTPPAHTVTRFQLVQR